MNILCLIGDSGTGKSTIAKQMVQHGIHTIVSYTTRPQRDGEVNHLDHHFITEDGARETLATQRPMAYTLFGGYRYFTLMTQVMIYNKRNDNTVLTYVIDEQGYLSLISALREYHLRMSDTYGYTDVNPIQVCAIRIERSEVGADVDADRRARDVGRTTLPGSFYRLRIVNDAPTVSDLRGWCEDFAQAIAAAAADLPSAPAAPVPGASASGSPAPTPEAQTATHDHPDPEAQPSAESPSKSDRSSLLFPVHGPVFGFHPAIVRTSVRGVRPILEALSAGNEGA